MVIEERRRLEPPTLIISNWLCLFHQLRLLWKFRADSNISGWTWIISRRIEGRMLHCDISIMRKDRLHHVSSITVNAWIKIVNPRITPLIILLSVLLLLFILKSIWLVIIRLFETKVLCLTAMQSSEPSTNNSIRFHPSGSEDLWKDKNESSGRDPSDS